MYMHSLPSCPLAVLPCRTRAAAGSRLRPARSSRTEQAHIDLQDNLASSYLNLDLFLTLDLFLNSDRFLIVHPYLNLDLAMDNFLTHTTARP